MDPLVLFILIILGALLLGIIGYQVYSVLYERERMTKNAYMQLDHAMLQKTMTDVTKAIGKLSTDVTGKNKAMSQFLLRELSLMQEASHFQKKL